MNARQAPRAWRVFGYLLTVGAVAASSLSLATPVQAANVGQSNFNGPAASLSPTNFTGIITDTFSINRTVPLGDLGTYYLVNGTGLGNRNNASGLSCAETLPKQSLCTIGAGFSFTYLARLGTFNVTDGTNILGTITVTAASGSSGGSAADVPQTDQINLDVNSGYRCSASQVQATRGTWVDLPKAAECTPPASKPRAVLLGWATSPTFSVAIAQRQVRNGWGAYETFGPTGSLTGVFIPVGKPAFVTGGGVLYSIWSE